MFTKVQKELINDLLDLFAETYKNVNWHQTGAYLKYMPYCNWKNEVLNYKKFILNLRWEIEQKTQFEYIANKLYKSIIKMCKYNH